MNSLKRESIKGYDASLLSALTKTACAFMNTDGGTISIELTRYNEKSGYPEKTVEQILETWREKFKLKSKTGEQILASQVNHIIVPGEKSGQCTIHFEIKVLNHKNDYVYINNVKQEKMKCI